jgi:hypothetical protein
MSATPGQHVHVLVAVEVGGRNPSRSNFDNLGAEFSLDLPQTHSPGDDAHPKTSRREMQLALGVY